MPHLTLDTFTTCGLNHITTFVTCGYVPKFHKHAQGNDYHGGLIETSYISGVVQMTSLETNQRISFQMV